MCKGDSSKSKKEQDVTSKEMKEISEVMTAELNRLGKEKKTPVKAESLNSTASGSMDETNDWKLEREKREIIEGCSAVIENGCKVLGKSFNTIVRPLLPLLCPLIDESWKWEKDLNDNLSRFSDKLREKVLLRYPPDETRGMSNDTNAVQSNSSYHLYGIDIPSEKEKKEVNMDFEEFCAIFKEMKSDDYDKSRAAEDKFDEVSSTLRIVFLWRIGMGSGVNEEREEALEKLAHVQCDGCDWSAEPLATLCKELLLAVESERSVKLRDQLTSVVGHFAWTRFDYKTQTHEWKEMVSLIDSCSSSTRVRQKLIALQIVEQCPFILGSATPSLVPFFEQSIDHWDAKLRLTAPTSFGNIIDQHDMSNELIKAFHPIFSILIKKIQKKLRESEKKEVLDCLLTLARRPLASLTPFIKELFALGKKLVFDAKEDLRTSSYRIIQSIIGNPWKEVTELVGEKAMDGMRETVLKRARCYISRWECRELARLIAQIGNCFYYEAGTTWKDLLKYIDDCALTMDPIAFEIIRWCPIIFLGQDEAFTRRLAAFIEIGCRGEEGMGWNPIQSSALDSFVALVNSSEAEDDERTASILESTTVQLIEMAQTEVEKNSEYFTVLYSLEDMIESKQLRPHLPRLMELFRRNAEQGDRYTSTRAVRAIRHRIQYNRIDIHCSSMADKSSFVADENLFDCTFNEDLNVDTDDHVFGKLRWSTQTRKGVENRRVSSIIPSLTFYS